MPTTAETRISLIYYDEVSLFSLSFFRIIFVEVWTFFVKMAYAYWYHIYQKNVIFWRIETDKSPQRRRKTKKKRAERRKKTQKMYFIIQKMVCCRGIVWNGFQMPTISSFSWLYLWRQPHVDTIYHLDFFLNSFFDPTARADETNENSILNWFPC